MKCRRSVGLLLGLSMLALSTPTALAHDFSSPTPVPGVAPLSDQEQYKLHIEHYKLDMEKYRFDMKQRELMRKEITKAFVSAIKAANSINNKTLGSDTRRAKAIVDAMLLRDQALEAMGEAPIEPTKPVKPLVTAFAKKTKTSKPSPTPSP